MSSTGSGSEGPGKAEAKARYLASQARIETTAAREELSVFAPVPVFRFTVMGKPFEVLHARNLKGLGRFLRLSYLLDAGRDKAVADEWDALRKRYSDLPDAPPARLMHQWVILRHLVPELPLDAWGEIDANTLDIAVSRATEGRGRPPLPEDALEDEALRLLNLAASAASLPPTGAGIPATRSAT